jgi:hypothetical protein
MSAVFLSAGIDSQRWLLRTSGTSSPPHLSTSSQQMVRKCRFGRRLLVYQNPMISQDRLGTNRGKVEKEDVYAGSFNPRISPTSFYALQTLAPTDAQAERMVTRWLTNRSAFCIAADGDYTGNDEEGCYWGLPSINAADPAFPHGYWRGAVWGPMAQLTYWSLQHYDHVPVRRHTADLTL